MAGTTESWDLIFGGVDQVSASESDFHFSRKIEKLAKNSVKKPVWAGLFIRVVNYPFN